LPASSVAINTSIHTDTGKIQHISLSVVMKNTKIQKFFTIQD
jgi:hypothetical protein